MTKILGISGRKQSGKNTVASFLHGMEMVSAGIISDFRFSTDGQLIVPIQTIAGDGKESIEYGAFEVDRKDPDFVEYMSSNVWPFIKLYSFADMLKMNICIQVLGLSYEQCYGTDKDKNTETHLKWTDMPTGNPNDNRMTTTQSTKNMTAREVMQYIGTDLFRKMDTDIWVKATLRQIELEGPALAVVCDCRFPNEVRQIKQAGGKVVRMNRNNHGDDNHASETMLDPENFDWKEFDAVVDNQNMDVRQANEKVYQLLKTWNFVGMEYERT